MCTSKQSRYLSHSSLFQVKVPKPVRQPIPQLRLPKPSILADLYAYLRTRKIKILEVFSKVERGESQRISREEFIMALKAVSMNFSAGPGVCPPSVRL